MTVLDDPDPVAVTFEDVQTVLEKVARRFVQDHGGHYEDILCDANWYYLKAYDDYVPERGEFRRWVQYRVRMGLLEDLRRAAYRHVTLPRKNVPLAALTAKEAAVFDPGPVLDRLGTDAAFLVKLVLEVPDDLQFALDMRTRATDYDFKLTIRSYLKESGWAVERIAAAFAEVRSVL